MNPPIAPLSADKVLALKCFNYIDILERINTVVKDTKKLQRDIDKQVFEQKLSITQKFDFKDHCDRLDTVLASPYEPVSSLCARILEFVPRAFRHKLFVCFIRKPINQSIFQPGNDATFDTSGDLQIDILDEKTRLCSIRDLKPPKPQSKFDSTGSPGNSQVSSPNHSQHSQLSSQNDSLNSPTHRLIDPPAILGICAEIPLMTVKYERVVYLRPIRALLSQTLFATRAHIRNELERIGLPTNDWSLVMCRLVRDSSKPATEEVQILDLLSVDDNWSIESLLQLDNSNLMIIAQKPFEREGTKDVKILRIEGPEIRMAVDPMSTVLQLRKIIANHLDCTMEEVHLTASAEQCTDHQILSSLFLLPDSTKWRVTLIREKPVLLESQSKTYPVRYFNQSTLHAVYDLIMYKQIGKFHERQVYSLDRLIDLLCTARTTIGKVHAAVSSDMLVGQGKDGAKWIDQKSRRLLNAVREERYIALDDELPILPRIDSPVIVEEILIEDEEEPPPSKRRRRNNQSVNQSSCNRSINSQSIDHINLIEPMHVNLSDELIQPSINQSSITQSSVSQSSTNQSPNHINLIEPMHVNSIDPMHVNLANQSMIDLDEIDIANEPGAPMLPPALERISL